MKSLFTIAAIIILLSPAYGQKSDIGKIVNTLNMLIDSSWTISVDTIDIRKDRFDRGVLIGVVHFTTKKRDKLDLLLCNYSSDSLFKKGVIHYQNSASCLLSEDIETHRSILRIENYCLFLPMYPCWSGYSKNAQELMKELVKKTEH